jgi:hypothetical protein
VECVIQLIGHGQSPAPAQALVSGGRHQAGRGRPGSRLCGRR